MAIPSSTKRQQVPSLAGMQASARAGHYILEQKVQKRYRFLLFSSLPTLYPGLPLPGEVGPFAHDAYKQLCQDCFPKHFTRNQKDPGRVYVQAEERIEEEIPEFLSRLPYKELKQVASLLDQNNLLGTIQLVWHTFRPILNRLDPTPAAPRQKPAPKPKTKIVPFGEPLVLTPPVFTRISKPKPRVCHLPKPKLRVQGRQLCIWPPVTVLLPFLGAGKE
jgi:hypothetical protein